VARLCEAWTAAKHLHPYLAYREIDWDAAFVRAAPAVWEATDREGYRAAAEEMLAALDDAASEVREEPGPDPPFAPGEPPPLFRWPAEGVLLVDVAGFQRVAGAYALSPALWQGIDQALEQARALIIDLRIAPETGEGQDRSTWHLQGHAGRLVSREGRGLSERFLVHWGFRPQEGFSSGGYHSGFVTTLAPVYAPADPDAPERPVVFLANARTRLPDFAFALQASGTGRIVSEGPLAADRLVSRVTVELGEGLEARIRATELVTPDGGPPAADLEVAPAEGDADPGLEAALALLAEPFAPRASAATAPGADPPPPARWRPDAKYPEMLTPDLGHRFLAGCRLWGTMELFYPYLHLLDDWDGAFREALPELAAAEDGAGYVRALVRLAAHVEDGHTGLWGHPGLAEVRGESFPPIQIREIEGRIVVARVLDRAVRDLAAGDVVHAVDGAPIEDRIEELWPLVTASRELLRRLVAARWSMAGPKGSTVTLTVSGAGGDRRQVELRRGEPADPAPRGDGDPWRLLEDTGGLRLGYVDLTRLQVPQVDAVIAALGETDAIVFDMRGYPHGTAWPLAGWLNSRGEKRWAQFRRREVSYQLYGAPESGHYFVQDLTEPREETYRGRTVMLIDERAISQAEHTGLAFEQAAGTVFIGTPTAGANGDVTSLSLPGGISVYFTGHDVRHADGRQLQRLGIQPDVEVAPTIEGLRAGRDEVLERAVEYLREELGEGGE
jgi:C-terminal processing protease CtpA/Prc